MSVADVRQVQTLVLRFAVRVAHLMRAAQTYPEGHPTRLRAADTLIAMAEEVLSFVPEVTFFTGETQLTVLGAPVAHGDSVSALLKEMHGFLGERALGGLTLRGGVDRAQLDAFLAVLLAADADLGPDVINEQLTAAAVTNLRVVSGAKDTVAAGHAHDPNLQALRLYLRGVRAIDRLQKRGVSPAMMLELADVAEGCVTLLEATPRRALALATPRAVLPYELRHPVHMAILAIAIGHRLGLPRASLVDLALCGLLVDVGMREVPMALRERPGKLEPDELALIQSHPARSVAELLRLPTLDAELRRRLVVTFEHHLGINAKGYPKTLSWGELHPYSRILAIADAWDAQRANTAYRKGRSVAEVLASLRSEAGTRYDPVLVDVLASAIIAWGGDAAHG
jgi:HD-GYP domain-containing protein (c-di-GMP phosphodiesterase class II)